MKTIIQGSVKDNIIDILTKEMHLHPIENEDFTVPYQTAGLDSLDFVEFCILLERKYDILIEDKELAKCITLNDVITLVEKTINT